MINFLRQPANDPRLGGRVPKGVLLVGPLGTGKTLLARVVAGETGVPFFSIACSEFIEMIVGVGAARVRDFFAQAKAAPAIIFLDELDAIGRRRGGGNLTGGNDDREQTLNQLLAEMDGFEADQTVIVLAAANRDDVLDPALLRPGRFDRRVLVPPDRAGRAAILRAHTRAIPLAADADLHALAAETPGLVGADLRNLVDEAALGAAHAGRDAVGRGDLQAALEKVALFWPGITVVVLLTLLGAYALVNGVLAVLSGIGGGPGVHRAALFASGAASVAFGILVWAWPGLTALTLLYCIALWAIVIGILEIVAAVLLRQEIANEWLMGFAGGLAVLFGVLCWIRPGSGALVLLGLTDVYAILFSLTLIALGFRLRALGGRRDAGAPLMELAAPMAGAALPRIRARPLPTRSGAGRGHALIPPSALPRRP